MTENKMVQFTPQSCILILIFILSFSLIAFILFASILLNCSFFEAIPILYDIIVENAYIILGTNILFQPIFFIVFFIILILEYSNEMAKEIVNENLYAELIFLAISMFCIYSMIISMFSTLLIVIKI